MKIENIKFKAKRLDGKGWAIGDLLHSYENGAIIVPIEGGGAFSVAPSTVCQFTGLKDCKGNEIWGHDLLQSQETKAIYEVVWNQGNTSFSLVNTECPVLYPNTLGGMLRNRRLKVVGNKFDKKEVSYGKTNNN